MNNQITQAKEIIKVLKAMLSTNQWNSVRNELEFAIQQCQMVNWIPVTSQLPNPEQEVYLYCKTKYAKLTYQCIGFYIPEKTNDTNSDYCWDWEMLDCDEEIDINYIKSGWYEHIYNLDDYGAAGINDEVLYWKPLDDGPMEG